MQDCEMHVSQLRTLWPTDVQSHCIQKTVNSQQILTLNNRAFSIQIKKKHIHFCFNNFYPRIHRMTILYSQKNIFKEFTKVIQKTNVAKCFE